MSKRRALVVMLITMAVAWGGLALALVRGLEPKLGLDLQGGFSVLLVAPDDTDPEVLDKAVEIMRLRIEGLGNVQEPEIAVQGDRNIQVQLPGVTDRQRALSAVGTTGELSFRPVLDIQPVSPLFLDGTLTLPGSTTETTISAPTTVPPDPVVPDNIDPETGLTIDDDPLAEAYLTDEFGQVYHVGPAILTGADVTGADAEFFGASAGVSGEWRVDPSFTGVGNDKFAAGTAQLTQFPSGDPRRQLAIVVDGEVFSAPVVDTSLAPGESLDPELATISVGSATEQEAEARDLATILRYGALPTAFEVANEDTVSASLGSDSLRAGLIAGLGGLALVAVALVAYYRALGLVAVMGLTVFGSFLLLAIILFGELQGVTLTLAGVAGIIVSIGITSDSYIVYFERIKEEVHHGRPLRSATDHAFKRAFRTILTGDTVSFAAAVLLWALAIGQVKGFAITLGIATVIDVIVAYFFTRVAVAYLVRTGLGEGGSLSIRGAVRAPSTAEGVA